MFHRSDVNKRLPRFREALASIEDVRKQGGLERVPQAVLDCLEALEPSGFDARGCWVEPQGDTRLQPPVAMLLPGEVGKRVRLRDDPGAIRASKHILGLAGIKDALPKGMLSDGYAIPDSGMWVNSATFTVAQGDSASRRTVYVPRLIYVGSEVTIDMLGSGLGHEADHWDFYFEEGPRLQSDAATWLSPEQMSTVAEKRAYGLSYRMEYDMGNYGTLASPEVLAQDYAPMPPTEAGAIFDDLVRRREAAGIVRKNTSALAALVFQHLFGEPDRLVTEAEVVAFMASNLAE